MKKLVWNPDKAEALLRGLSRNNVGFEECVVAIEAGRVPADIPNPSLPQANQRILVFEIQ